MLIGKKKSVMEDHKSPTTPNFIHFRYLWDELHVMTNYNFHHGSELDM